MPLTLPAGWMEEDWPRCCNLATELIGPAGVAEIRKSYPALEGELLGHIVYNMSITGDDATRLLESLDAERGPAVYLFQCRSCHEYQFYIGSP